MARREISGRKLGQGSKWIAQSTRLAIYLRDGLACAYCGASLESGASLSLDHLKPCVAGGSNAPTNLVTCCKHCNDSRQDRPVRTFCRAVAEYTLRDATEIERHVRACARRALPREMARELIARRGSYSAAMAAKGQ
jgi:5-methylcytosine-specific restriction endonuclease McrA